MRVWLLNYYPKGPIWWRFVAPPNQNSSILSPIFLCLNSMYCCRGFLGEGKWWWSGGCTVPLLSVLVKLGLLKKMKIQNMWKWETTYANKWMMLRFKHLVWKSCGLSYGFLPSKKCCDISQLEENPRLRGLSSRAAGTTGIAELRTGRIFQGASW